MDTTKNYGLKQWDGSDRILRTDFNENNLSIEAALDAKQKNIDALDNRLTASIANLSQTVAQHHSSRVRIITGTYVGNGAEERHIEIGEEVSLIFIWWTAADIYYPHSMTLLPQKGVTVYGSGTTRLITHTGSGFDILRPAEFNNASDGVGRPYTYLAFVLDT